MTSRSKSKISVTNSIFPQAPNEKVQKNQSETPKKTMSHKRTKTTRSI